MSAPAIEPPLTLERVSVEYDIPEETLRHWRKVGKGPRSYKVGRRVRYDRADVAAWFEARRAAGVGGVE